MRTTQNIKSEKIRAGNKSVMMTNELSDAIDQSVIFQMRYVKIIKLKDLIKLITLTFLF